MEDKYDTFLRRFVAGILDGLILAPFGMVLDWTLVQSHSEFLVIMGTVATYVLSFAYSVYFHSQTGQTFGKKWMNIRVIDKDESRLLTLEQAFKRDSIYILLQTIGILVLVYQIVQSGDQPYEDSAIEIALNSLGLIWFVLEVVTMMTNDKRRALHDFLADSVVIKEEYWTGPDKQVSNK